LPYLLGLGVCGGGGAHLMGGSGGGGLEEVETQENEQPLLVFEWCGMTGGTGNQR